MCPCSGRPTRLIWYDWIPFKSHSGPLNTVWTLLHPLTLSPFFCHLAGVAGNTDKHHPAQPGPGSGRLRWLCHAHCHLQNATVNTGPSLWIIDAYTNSVGDFDEIFTALQDKSCCNNDILPPFRPRYSILGHVPGTDLYLDTECYEKVRAYIYIVSAPDR